MEFNVIFFSSAQGEEPVKNFLAEVFKKNSKLWASCIDGIEKIKQKIYHKEPTSKALGNGLYEIRANADNNIARIIYVFAPGRTIVLLHGFIKKTQKTPRQELEIAQQRLKFLKEQHAN